MRRVIAAIALILVSGCAHRPPPPIMPAAPPAAEPAPVHRHAAPPPLGPVPSQPVEPLAVTPPPQRAYCEVLAERRAADARSLGKSPAEQHDIRDKSYGLCLRDSAQPKK